MGQAVLMSGRSKDRTVIDPDTTRPPRAVTDPDTTHPPRTPCEAVAPHRIKREAAGPRRIKGLAAGVVTAGVLGGLLAVAGGAGAQPQLPPVAPEDLVSSVLAAADPGPFTGTVTLENNLGLPALPDAPQAANGTSTATIWSGGDRKGRVALPSDGAERTLVSDGTTHWAWNSADRTVVRGPVGAQDRTTDPTAAASKAIADLRATSTVAVDGTASVAGRDAYELVLTPAPTERTLLREVRVAVDAEKRMPLRLVVLATGSTEPALQVGYSKLEFGPQDPALFTFTPPEGATVTDEPARDPAAEQARAAATTVGDGWDTVKIMRRPATPDATTTTARPDAPDLSTIGTPVTGSWGSGRLITTAVGSAIVTDDGRIAAGAVPEQVLTEALSR
jgi:outer membrane lipoprotein-sorting protein